MTSLPPASAVGLPSPAPAAPFMLSPCRPVSLSTKAHPFRVHAALNPGVRNPETITAVSAVAIAAAVAAAAISGFTSTPPAVAAAPAADVDVDVAGDTTSYALSDTVILDNRFAGKPSDVAGLRALMEAKIAAGEFRDAVAAIDRLMEVQPRERDLPILRSHMLLRDGDFSAAHQGFEALLASDPLSVEAYHGLVTVAHKSSEDEIEIKGVLRRVEVAMERCKKERKLDNVREFKLLVAQIKIMEGEYDDALRICKELLKEEPRDFRPYLCQGIVYTILKKKDEADKQLKKYRRLVPKGHPYSLYFDEGMAGMKVLVRVGGNKKQSGLSL